MLAFLLHQEDLKSNRNPQESKYQLWWKVSTSRHLEVSLLSTLQSINPEICLIQPSNLRFKRAYPNCYCTSGDLRWLHTIFVKLSGAAWLSSNALGRILEVRRSQAPSIFLLRCLWFSFTFPRKSFVAEEKLLSCS